MFSGEMIATCQIAGFYHVASEVFTLVCCYTAYVGSCYTDVSVQPVNNYQYTLRNNPEERILKWDSIWQSHENQCIIYMWKKQFISRWY